MAKAKNTTRRRRRTTVYRRRTRRTNSLPGYSADSQKGSTSFRMKLRKLHKRGKSAQAKYLKSKRPPSTGVWNWDSQQYRNPRRRRNPSLFGTSLTSKEGLMILAGGLAGVAGSKFIPTLLPSSLTGSIASSNVGQTVLTGVSAVALGWIGLSVAGSLQLPLQTPLVRG